ncbi:MAG TPA: ABC transporter permease [Burkholderiaceae bacterium]|nr:ABC transporter permease [Burkholderiaceae bacterium]
MDSSIRASASAERVRVRGVALNPRLVFGAAVLAALLAMALFAPALAPHDPLEQSLFDQRMPPAWMDGGETRHLLGTDNLGRDILSRLIHGARPAVTVMALGATLSALVGVALGLLAGFFGGWIDAAISRTVDTFMSFPPMLLAIVLAAVMGPGLTTVVIAVVLIGWTRFCRVIRGEVIALRDLDFVTSARTAGATPMRIVVHEVLPNLAPLATVLLSLEMGRAIVVEAVLSFIGFSSSDVATWGGVIADGRNYVNQAWWVMTWPTLVIIVCVLALNALGDGLRQATDPVLRR